MQDAVKRTLVKHTRLPLLLAGACAVVLGAEGACTSGGEQSEEPEAHIAPREDNDDPESVSFTYVRDQVIVPAYVNEHGPFNFIIDTGGNPSLLSLRAVEEAELKIDADRSGEAEGVGSGAAQIFAAEIPNLRIGKRSFGDFQAVAMDLSRISERLGVELHGILGFNFLKNRVTVFDYVNQRLSFPEPDPRTDYAAYTDSPNAYSTPLQFREDDTIPLISGVSIAGVELTLTLDTGSNIPLELFPRAVEALGFEEEFAAGGQSTAVGARGETRIRKMTLDQLHLGPIALGNLDVRSRAEARGSGEDGNMGTPLLKDLRLTLDYANGHILFERLR